MTERVIAAMEAAMRVASVNVAQQRARECRSYPDTATLPEPDPAEWRKRGWISFPTEAAYSLREMNERTRRRIRYYFGDHSPY